MLPRSEGPQRPSRTHALQPQSRSRVCDLGGHIRAIYNQTVRDVDGGGLALAHRLGDPSFHLSSRHCLPLSGQLRYAPCSNAAGKESPSLQPWFIDTIIFLIGNTDPCLARQLGSAVLPRTDRHHTTLRKQKPLTICWRSDSSHGYLPSISFSSLSSPTASTKLPIGFDTRVPNERFSWQISLHSVVSLPIVQHHNTPFGQCSRRYCLNPIRGLLPSRGLTILSMSSVCPIFTRGPSS